MTQLPAGTAMGAVHVTVADLDRSVSFWRDGIGLELLERESGRASLGAGGRELLGLIEQPGATAAPRTTGLYHVALLVPGRTDLARWLAHAASASVPLRGASDHYVSEALYLRDPDGHGIEIYVDRPRELWEGQVADRMTSLPLDLEDLLREVNGEAREPYAGLPAGTTVGHIHLKFSELEETGEFYRDVLGFEATAAVPGQALFFAAGGYHHHVAGNVWESRNAPPPPEGAVALRHATVVLPTPDDRDAVTDRLADAGHEVTDAPEGRLVRDPSGNPLVLAA
jgi:catechol 2,3-dioxygenase